MATITNRYGCLQINAPEWYRREDFVMYLRGDAHTGERVATWHRGEKPNDFLGPLSVVRCCY